MRAKIGSNRSTLALDERSKVVPASGAVAEAAIRAFASAPTQDGLRLLLRAWLGRQEFSQGLRYADGRIAVDDGLYAQPKFTAGSADCVVFEAVDYTVSAANATLSIAATVGKPSDRWMQAASLFLRGQVEQPNQYGVFRLKRTPSGVTCTGVSLSSGNFGLSNRASGRVPYALVFQTDGDSPSVVPVGRDTLLTGDLNRLRILSQDAAASAYTTARNALTPDARIRAQVAAALVYAQGAAIRDATAVTAAAWLDAASVFEAPL